jgi:hypothetical protein
MAGVCSTFWSSCTPPRRTQNDSCFPVVSWRINIDLKSFLSISLEGACLHVSTFSGLLWLCVASKAEAGCLSPRSLRALILTSPWATKQKWCNAIKTASPAFKESQMLCLSTYLCRGNGEPCICVCMYTCQCMHANVCMCVCVYTALHKHCTKLSSLLLRTTTFLSVYQVIWLCHITLHGRCHFTDEQTEALSWDVDLSFLPISSSPVCSGGFPWKALPLPSVCPALRTCWNFHLALRDLTFSVVLRPGGASSYWLLTAKHQHLFLLQVQWRNDGTLELAMAGLFATKKLPNNTNQGFL